MTPTWVVPKSRSLERFRREQRPVTVDKTEIMYTLREKQLGTLPTPPVKPQIVITDVEQFGDFSAVAIALGSDERLTCIYSSDPAQIGSTANIQARNGLSVLLSLPAAGLIIFK